MVSNRRDDLLDALADLQHDLGKHAPLPLRMLPADADDRAVRAAARDALRRTRRGPNGVTDAATLWDDFRVEVGPLPAGPAADALREAVARALAWDARLDAPAPLDRAALTADLAALSPAIRALMDAVADG
jgi:hypothetical protein